MKGTEHTTACLQTLDDWLLKSQVRGLRFDMMASNTWLNLSACSLIEKALDEEPVWIPCRYHIFKVSCPMFSIPCLNPAVDQLSVFFNDFKRNGRI